MRKTVQDKVYLYVFHYYILYVKTVFQWRPIGGKKQECLGILELWQAVESKMTKYEIIKQEIKEQIKDNILKPNPG